ncbi:amidohydrolase family protein [Sphingorhabdus sp. Alg239-R122]|uniref:Xaa-Pro dipeptidase n=1 Tax=Sphingorhabdus sp. Alg239-R122 TaxID=2305989 RepID=UPI0023DD80AD|nr:amidohydrolase family protein [Sphingorhabdus sp. Alg239-R122]
MRALDILKTGRWTAYIAAAGLALHAPAAYADTVVVTAGHMVDTLNGTVTDNPVVTVTDGRIVSVSSGTAPETGPETGDDVRRVDLPGMTIMPGLIDMHVHLTGLAEIGGYRTFQYTDAFWTVAGVANARATVEAGFTTVRNLGSSDYADVALKQGIERGLVPGPRIVPATYAIGVTGGHCDNNFLPPSYDAKSEALAEGKAALRARVREHRKYGAEVIKICATGGVFSKGTTVGEQQMTVDEIRDVVEIAHILGMKVAAHAHGNDGIKAAIRGGVDTIEHASYLDDEAIRMAKEAGVAFSMDIYNTEYTLAEGEKNGVLEESLAKERQVGGIQRESFRKAVKAGANVVFGSDAAIFPHGLNARQLPVMVRFGMTPVQALQAATSEAARALGRENDVGAIAVGRYGDIIAVQGNPTQDVSIMTNVRFVMKGGEVVKNAR